MENQEGAIIRITTIGGDEIIVGIVGKEQQIKDAAAQTTGIEILEFYLPASPEPLPQKVAKWKSFLGQGLGIQAFSCFR